MKKITRTYKLKTPSSTTNKTNKTNKTSRSTSKKSTISDKLFPIPVSKPDSIVSNESFESFGSMEMIPTIGPTLKRMTRPSEFGSSAGGATQKKKKINKPKNNKH